VCSFICVCSCKTYHVLWASAFNLHRCYCAIGFILFLFFSLSTLFLLCIHIVKYASKYCRLMKWTKLQCGLVRTGICQTDLVSIFEKVLPERLLRENTLDSKTPDILNLKRISVCAKSLQLCTALCNPMDCSPSGSSVHGILQD